MDTPTPLRQSASVSSRLSTIDVSQLDKINAIPNKTTNNVLLDGLCQEDQLYLDALMDEESQDSDDETPNLTDHGGSAWSPPMARSPMINSKRIKRIKPAYTITLSLEDISYIRPSWGISKGIKRIELNKNKRKKQSKKVQESKLGAKGKSEKAHISAGGNESEQQGKNQKETKSLLSNTYHVSLAILVLILVSFMVLSYFVDIRRHHEKRFRFRLDFAPNERSFKIMKVQDGSLVEHRALKVSYGRGIPVNLRHDECSCEMYMTETRRYQQETSTFYGRKESDMDDASKGGDCFACYDWSYRANLQILVNNSMLTNHLEAKDMNKPTVITLNDEDQSVTCYDVKWQSYDTLRTPLVDCFHINDGDQWFGLGDLQNPIWPLSKVDQQEAALLASNLSSEFSLNQVPAAASHDNHSSSDQAITGSPLKSADTLSFGSHAELQLLTSSGFFVGNLRTDFRTSIKISAGRREICLSVACSERCTRVWSRAKDIERFQYRNNLLEYSICSANNVKVLMSRLVAERSKRPSQASHVDLASSQANTKHASAMSRMLREQSSSANLIERQELTSQEEQQVRPSTAPNGVGAAQQVHQAMPTSASPISASPKRQLDGLGLIERTIFVTSPEYIELLDGQTLRQYVDKVVKLNLKTSPILVLDTRWQLYLGSFRINAAYFPKAKLFFEILHNKGFKLVLTIKPYIDASIGVPALSQLLEAGRLVTANHRDHIQHFLDNNSNNIADGSSSSSTNSHPPQHSSWAERGHIFRRQSFFNFKNETILTARREHNFLQTPYLFKCKESHDGHCVLIDLVSEQNRLWLVDLIRRSSFLAQETDGILLAGTHPDQNEWATNYRNATAKLVDQLFYREGFFVLPQWTGNFNYIQLAPRQRDWVALKTTMNSVLTLSMLGFSLVHPGSVWGDLRFERQAGSTGGAPQFGVQTPGATPNNPAKLDVSSTDQEEEELRAEEELIVRWLQLSVFLPVLQFNDLAPIDKFNLHEQLQNLVKLRKQFIVPEIKKYLPPTPLLPNLNWATPRSPGTRQLPAYRLTWSNVVLNSGSSSGSQSQQQQQQQQQQQELQEAEAVSQQFMIGSDTLVAPVLNAGQRQKDIYLPAGIWHDELRQTNVRGGKWLRNYPIELNEVAWFTRARR